MDLWRCRLSAFADRYPRRPRRDRCGSPATSRAVLQPPPTPHHRQDRKPEAVACLAEIIDAADGIAVARGDLGWSLDRRKFR